MQFTISANKLLKDLLSMSRVIVTNPVVPILDSFLFDLSPGALAITASDLQSFIVSKLAVETQDRGRIAVPARMLIDTLKSLPDQPLTFQIDLASYSLRITTPHGRYKLACENATDFPQVPAKPEAARMDMDASALKKALSYTLVAASKDELRPLLSGLHLILSKQGTTFVATDGHRLARYVCGDVRAAQEQRLTVPSKPLQLLHQLLADAASVQCSFQKDAIHFDLGHVQLITRLIEGDYPDYENVIPLDNPHTLTVVADELLKALKRVDIYSNKVTHQVRLSLQAQRLAIAAEDRDFANEAHEELPCSYNGPALQIGFNAKLLIDLLGILSGQEVAFHLNTPSKAVLIKRQTADQAPEGDELLLLLMPILLKEAASSEA